MILDVVPKVVEIANQLITEDSANNDGDPIALSSLCQLYDELIETCQQQQSCGEGLSRISLLNQLARGQRQQVNDSITLEADLYRAVLGLSLYLLRKMISNPTYGVSTTLNQTIRQSFLLLNILAHLHALFTGMQMDTAPTRFPVLVQWIDSQQEYWTEQSATIITFDRNDLAIEEDQLLQMANTPTPWESNQVHRPIERNESLVAQIPISVVREADPSTTMIQVQFTDHGGMIRLLVDPVDDTSTSWWAALTASSTVHSQPPVLTITSVAVPRNHTSSLDSHKDKGCDVRTCSLELQVGQDGEKWRTATSRVIEQLQELEQLYDEVQALWPNQANKSNSSPIAPLQLLVDEQ